MLIRVAALRLAALVVFFLAGGAGAQAASRVAVCNDAVKTLYVAEAHYNESQDYNYQQGQGYYVSVGWIRVARDTCDVVYEGATVPEIFLRLSTSPDLNGTVFTNEDRVFCVSHGGVPFRVIFGDRSEACRDWRPIVMQDEPLPQAYQSAFAKFSLHGHSYGKLTLSVPDGKKAAQLEWLLSNEPDFIPSATGEPY